MLSFADFCRAFAQHVQTTRPAATLVAQDAEGHFSFVDERGERTALSIENAYKFYKASPDQITSLFDRTLALAAPVESISPGQLVAMVREDQGVLTSGSLTKRFAPGLVLAVAADLGDRFVYPSAETLAQLNISAETAVRHAVANIDRLVGTVSAYSHETGFQMFGSSNDISSSLILSDGFVGSVRSRSKGEAVFIVVGRNFLVVGDSASSASVQTMCDLAKTTEPGPHAISTTPIVNRDGRWEIFEN